jgi:hypothetical protein
MTQLNGKNNNKTGLPAHVKSIFERTFEIWVSLTSTVVGLSKRTEELGFIFRLKASVNRNKEGI